MSQKILLVQLASLGDCLFVTTIAKQIKEIDYPKCHLTWMITSRCRQVIKNNPFIDNVIEIPLNNLKDIQGSRNSIAQYMNANNYSALYDKIFVTDFTKENAKNWYGTTRSSLFRSYPHELKINPQPIIFLDDTEKKNVATFCMHKKITDRTFNILVEYAPQSGQSRLNFHRVMYIANQIVAKAHPPKIILSSVKAFDTGNENIIDASSLSWRENAELANYCDLIVGCSSGISWLCTSNATKQLPFIQVIDPNYMNGRFSASMKLDFLYFGIETANLIEMWNPTDEQLKDCILKAIIDMPGAKKKYDIDNELLFC